MSLIIITESKNKNGNYELTERKLRDLIQDAYNKGYTDGKLAGNSNTGWPLNPTPTPYYDDNIRYKDSNKPTPWWTEVTCSGEKVNISTEDAQKSINRSLQENAWSNSTSTNPFNPTVTLLNEKGATGVMNNPNPISLINEGEQLNPNTETQAAEETFVKRDLYNCEHCRKEEEK